MKQLFAQDHPKSETLTLVFSLDSQQHGEALSEVHRDRHRFFPFLWIALECKPLPPFLINRTLRPGRSSLRDWLGINLYVGGGE